VTVASVDQTAFADVRKANNPNGDTAALGLYALRRQSNARAVPDARFVH
jgi:hypothetical protein